jgi:Spy/CpxP family protein refolding chaperone
MKQFFCASALVLAASVVLVLPAASQPPGDRGPGQGRSGGPPGGRPGGPPDRQAPPPGPGGGMFEPGKVLPPHIRDALDLTEEQQDQLDRLEKDVKNRLMKILTADQKKTLKEMRSHGPGRDAGPNQREMRRGPGGPPPGAGRPGGPGDPGPGGPPDRDNPSK